MADERKRAKIIAARIAHIIAGHEFYREMLNTDPSQYRNLRDPDEWIHNRTEHLLREWSGKAAYSEPPPVVERAEHPHDQIYRTFEEEYADGLAPTQEEENTWRPTTLPDQRHYHCLKP